MRTTQRWRLAASLAGIIAAAGMGCMPPRTQVRGYRAQPAPAPLAPHAAPRAPSQPSRGPARPHPSDTAEGQELSDRLILAADGLLADAQVLGNRRLNVTLGPKADTETLPTLIRALVLVMHRRFPASDIAVQVCAPHGETIVVASLDASEGVVTYTFPP